MAISLTIDWISCTAHESITDGEFMVFDDLQKWHEWELTRGGNGYDNGAKHKSGLRAYKSSTRNDMGQHYIYSGSTLSWIEKEYGKNGINVLLYHVKKKHNIARLDVAVDFKGQNIDVQSFVNAYNNGKCTTALKKASEIKSIGESGHTFYIGSTKKRKKLVRIYDKGAETGDNSDWIRVELQVMGKPATTLAKMISRGRDPKLAMIGAIKATVNFDGIPQWDKFCGMYHEVKIGSQSAKVSDPKEWLEKQVFPSLVKVGIDDRRWLENYIDAVLRAVNKGTIE